jgi:hypothetical protein
MKERSVDESQGSRHIRAVVSWLIVLFTGLFALTFLYGAAIVMFREYWIVDIARQHFAATIGLPFAGLAALCIVLILEIKSGAIEFEGLGFRFRGASGPVVLWAFCFLVIAGAIRLVW